MELGRVERLFWRMIVGGDTKDDDEGMTKDYGGYGKGGSEKKWEGGEDWGEEQYSHMLSASKKVNSLHIQMPVDADTH